MEMVPRISRAQSMDALSSQASAAGYKAVLLAATELKKFFPMLTTAAGTIAPAKILIMGAGVAGLKAIATARRLGGSVEAFDIRDAAKGEVESLGAKFVEIELEEETDTEGGYAKQVSKDSTAKIQETLHKHVAASDVVITGVIDGPLSGGLPKAIELCVLNDISDLSVYGIGSANNGNGGGAEEFTFPAGPVSAGTFLYVASEASGFTSFFGFAPGYTSGAANINGDDAIVSMKWHLDIDTAAKRVCHLSLCRFDHINNRGTLQAFVRSSVRIIP